MAHVPVNRDFIASSMWDVHGCAKAAKVGLRLKGETREGESEALELNI
jgi:hypothetical protein